MVVWTAWLAGFAVLEVLAVLKRAPWSTFSEFAWMVEDYIPVARWILLIGGLLAVTHLALGIP